MYQYSEKYRYLVESMLFFALLVKRFITSGLYVTKMHIAVVHSQKTKMQDIIVRNCNIA
jgi:hypothetical protein